MKKYEINSDNWNLDRFKTHAEFITANVRGVDANFVLIEHLVKTFDSEATLVETVRSSYRYGRVLMKVAEAMHPERDGVYNAFFSTVHKRNLQINEDW